MKDQTAEPSNPTEYGQGRGKTTIAPEVLLTITQLTALQTPGVSRMSNVPGSVNRLFRRDLGEGVRIDVRDDTVYIDLYLVIKKDLNIREVSRQVQRNVARAISEMVGMVVGRVNIHIEDIDYSSDTPEEDTPQG